MAFPMELRFDIRVRGDIRTIFARVYYIQSYITY